MAEALLNQSLTGQEEEAETDEGRREEEEERRIDEGTEVREVERGAAGHEERQEEERQGGDEKGTVEKEARGIEEERKVQKEAEQPDEGRREGEREEEGEPAREEERQPDEGRREEEERGEVGEEARQLDERIEAGEEGGRGEAGDERRQDEERQGGEEEERGEAREEGRQEAGEEEEREAGEDGRQAEQEEGREAGDEGRQPDEGREAGEEEGRGEAVEEERQANGEREARMEEERQPEERREAQGEERQQNEGRREAQEEEREAEEEELEFEEDDDDDEDEEEEREAHDERAREEPLQPQQQNRGGGERPAGGGAVENRGTVRAAEVRGAGAGAGPGQIMERQNRMYWTDDLDRAQVARLTGKDWWQCNLATVKQRMAALLHLNKLFDVVLVFPKYQVEMKAHKLVLAMSSPVLEAMLYGPMSQAKEGRPHHLTLLEDLPATFEWLLRYLYRDETRFQGTVQALSVYEAAHKYQMDSLARLCSQYLADSVTPDNFPYVFDPAVLYEDVDLLNRCYEVAAVQGREVLSCPDLCVLRRPALHALLALPRLRVDKESFLFRALVQWGWYHLDEGPPPPAKPSVHVLPARRRLRAVIDEFLPYVRFLAMGLNEFVTEVEGSQLLSSEECMAVVRALRGIAPAPVLPDFISTDDTRRRKGLVTVAVLVRPPSNEPLSFEYREVLSINLMQNLTVSATLHLVRLASTGVCSLQEGRVVVWDEGGDHVARGVWSGNGCLFRRPVSLAVGRRYSAMLTLKEAWYVLSNTAINVTHKRIVFRGQTQIGGILRLEYMSGTFLPLSSPQHRAIDP